MPHRPHEFGTGAWAGTLATSLVGTAAFFLPRIPERAIIAGAGYAGGTLALVAAVFAMPELAWRHVWTFLAVLIAWAAAFVVSRLRSASVAAGWSAVAAPVLGVSAGLTASVAVFVESDPQTALWLAPLTSGIVACAAAVWARRPGRVGADGLQVLTGAGAVAGAASIPALVVATGALVRILSASVPPWQHEVLPEFDPASEAPVAALVAPFVIAAGVIGVLALLRRLRRLAALPTGLLLLAALAAGSMAEHAVTAAVVLLAVALAALVIATLPFTRAPGLIPVLAAGGMLGAVLASTLGYASAALWPWTSAAVLVLAIAGRVLARRIWPQTSATAIGAAHVAIASALAMGALVALVPWLATSDVRLAAPWDAPWMWVATGGALLLAAGAFVRLGNAADRIAFVVPALLATVSALGVALLAAPEAGWRWVPAILLVVAGLGWMRASNPLVTRIVFAATAPLALGYALGTLVAQLFGDDVVGIGVAAAALLAAALAHVVAPAARRAPSIMWVIAVAVVGRDRAGLRRFGGSRAVARAARPLPRADRARRPAGRPVHGDRSDAPSGVAQPRARHRHGLGVAGGRRRRRRRGLHPAARGRARRDGRAHHVAPCALRRHGDRPHGPLRCCGRGRRAAERRIDR